MAGSSRSPAADVAADLRRGEVDLRRFGRHGDVFFDGRRPERQIDLERRADSQDEIFLRQPAEAGELSLDMIRTGQQSGDQEGAVRLGDGFADGSILRMGDDNGHPRKHGLLFIDDAAADGGAALLRIRPRAAIPKPTATPAPTLAVAAFNPSSRAVDLLARHTVSGGLGR